MQRNILIGSLALGLLQPVALAEQGRPMQPMTITGNLAAHQGERVQIYGTLSQAPHQHLVAPEAARGSRMIYLDLDDAEQIVVYAPRAFKGCPGATSFTGEVLGLRATASKREAETGQKRAEDSGYREYQLKASAWACVSPDSPADWLRGLGLASVSLEHKRDLLDRLSALSDAGIPLLIGHTRDERLYGQRQEMPAAGINAPVNAPVPKPISVDISVSRVCEDLLYSMLMPEYISPYAGNFKPYSSSPFMVRNWPVWWQSQQGRSLTEIRKGLEPRVDAYWQSHGTVQILDE